jgi:crotonobetainyl-CoA:carnitine CoA-transferase CaiB-like acyl-CoA transferase
MALTGDAGGPPLAPPGELTGAVDRVASELARLTGVAVDGPVLLGERAALRRLRRQGDRSCGGATRLLPCADGWVAVALPRPEDVAALPALVADDLDVGTDPWPALADRLRARAVGEVVERAALLSLPVGAVPEGPAAAGAPWRRRGGPGRCRTVAGLAVVDLSSLWAGPLATGLLALAGARVTKVESATRPDGARRGSRRFWRLLNGAKEHRTVPPGALADELAAADVVVLGARRRAYEQLGIDVEEVLATRSDKVVVAVTGHGWDDDRVGFGDDAAAAGGLVARHPDDGRPRFLADAVADPLAGLHAAVAAATCATEGGRWFVDVSLAGVSRSLAGGAGTHLPALAAERRGRRWWLGDRPVATPRTRDGIMR